jgi:hypothetical protein
MPPQDNNNTEHSYESGELSSGEALGWYNILGTIWIRHDIASNPHLLGMVVNHELTHHYLIATTSYGFLQQIIMMGSQDASADLSKPEAVSWPTVEKDTALLLAASREAQEAAATFTGLVLEKQEFVETELTRYPSVYRDGYKLLRSLFDQYQFDVLTQLRLARTIVARAFQTSLLKDWFPENLADPQRLETYLSQPENRPNDRLKRIIDVLKTWTEIELISWVGKMSFSEGNIRLSPETTSPIAGLSFTALPNSNEAVAMAREVIHQLVPGMTEQFLERVISTFFPRGPRPPQIALIRPRIINRLLRDSTLDDEWCSEVDFILVDGNPLREPMRLSGSLIKLPTKQAFVEFYRPDYSTCCGTRVPFSDVPKMLSSTPALAEATVCFSLQSALAFDMNIKDFLPSLLRRRHMFYYNGSSWDFFELFTLVMTNPNMHGPWVYHASLAEPKSTWGYILIRSLEKPWPFIVFITLADAWEEALSWALDHFKFQFEPSAAKFFVDKGSLRDFTRFQRYWVAQELPIPTWKQLAELGEAMFLNSPLKKNEGDRSLKSFEE